MYALDGIPLTNTTYGWYLEHTSEPRLSLSKEVADFNATNRNGTIQTRGRLATPTVTLIVITPLTGLEQIRRLMRLASSLTDTNFAGKALTVEAVTVTSTTLTSLTEMTQVTGVFRVPNVFWRDTATTTWGPTTLTTTGQAVSVFTTTSGLVTDALISVSGSITGLAVQGSNGTYFSYAPNVPSGTFLTFDATTGRAWTGTSAFAKTTEVTANIANGPGPYFLEVAPTSSDPAVSGCTLTVTWTAMTGATIRVQGANAYDR